MGRKKCKEVMAHGFAAAVKTLPPSPPGESHSAIHITETPIRVTLLSLPSLMIKPSTPSVFCSFCHKNVRSCITSGEKAACKASLLPVTLSAFSWMGDIASMQPVLYSSQKFNQDYRKV